MIAQQFIDEGYPVKKVLKVLRLARSSYYYNPVSTRGKGCKSSTHTLTEDGTYVSNERVDAHMRQIISDII